LSLFSLFVCCRPLFFPVSPRLFSPRSSLGEDRSFLLLLFSLSSRLHRSCRALYQVPLPLCFLTFFFFQIATFLGPPPRFPPLLPVDHDRSLPLFCVSYSSSPLLHLSSYHITLCEFTSILVAPRLPPLIRLIRSREVSPSSLNLSSGFSW